MNVRQESGVNVELLHRPNIGGFKMSELEQLEQQVLELSPENLAKFRAWFIERDYESWDKQIEADVASGKLDNLIAEARTINSSPSSV
jgi:hypothetical protein